MKAVWEHPRNDQRPGVRCWLAQLDARQKRIVDIGCGDAYYMPDLAPVSYAAVEPNVCLRHVTQDSAAHFGISARVYPTIYDLLQAGELRQCDVVLMIHVLFYLDESEAVELFREVVGKPIVMVHPDPDDSVTVSFEGFLGCRRARRLVAIKERLLGPPRARQVMRSHFVVSSDTPAEDLAFLVGHHLLDGEDDEACIARAKRFVEGGLPIWRHGSDYEIPQSQILEVYNSETTSSGG